MCVCVYQCNITVTYEGIITQAQPDNKNIIALYCHAVSKYYYASMGLYNYVVVVVVVIQTTPSPMLAPPLLAF